jgi:pimeloyl-ACP methyl ester carboxylesterase
MPHITTDDGVELYYEETGGGIPLVFAHEYGGDARSWEPQVRHFARTYRCIVFNARGYPPSDVPADVAMYGQQRACDDIRAVLDGLGIDKAHIIGLSMGGFATLHFGMQYADRARSLVVGGAGYGAPLEVREQFARESLEVADRIEADTMAVFGKSYAIGPARVQFLNKDPRGWQEFADQLCEHSTLGSVNTMRGLQAKRPSLYDFADAMKAMRVPTLIVNGDEDEPCLEVGLFLKRSIPSSGLVVLPGTGHLTNLEEPALFNQLCGDFLARVDAGRWPLRDPRATATDILWTPDS